MKKLIIITICGILLLTASTAQAGFFDWVGGLFDSAKNNLGTAVRIFTAQQGGTGIGTSTASDVGKYLKVSDDNPFTYAFDTPAGGSGGGTTTTIAGLQPDTDIFFLTSTSGIDISTSSPATIRFNLGIATTTQLAITSLAGQTGCLSVSATGKVATSTCSGGSGLTNLNGQTGGTQTFATSSDTNIHIRVGSAGDIHTLTPAWAGTLADSRIASANTWNAKITTSSLSSTATGLSYDNVGGIFSWTAGYEGLKTTSSTDWNTAYADRLKWDGGSTGLVAATGRTSLGLTDTATLASSTWLKVANNLSDGTASTMRTNLGLGTLATGNTVPYSSTTGFSFATSGAANIRIASSSGTWTFSQATSTGSVNGFLLATDWTTFNAKQATITDGIGLTFTGATLNCDTASGLIQGCLTSADWTTFNNKQATMTATLPILITANDISLTGRLSTINSLATTTGNLIVAKTDATGWYSLGVGTNGKVLTASSTATNGISWETIVASASAGGADTNIQVNEAGTLAGYSTLTYSSSTDKLSVGSSTISGSLIIPQNKTLTTAGQIAIDTSKRVLSFYDGTASVNLNPEQCSQPFTIQYPTSTAGTYYNAKGIPFAFFPATSTLTYIYGVNASAGDTTTFNITYNPSINSATTTYAVFSSQQTITSTSTATRLTPTASSTPNQFDQMRVSFSSASSTQFSVGACWR